jgi:SAM-dependent methyltransferase
MEEEQNINFERYLKSLDISKEGLKDKRILDLGCGDGEFVKECLDENISKEIYGLDLQINPEKLEERHKKHFLKGDFQKELPIKDLDLIISLGAVKAPFHELDMNNPKTTIDSALKALKENGEIRIFPLRKTHPNNDLKGVEFSEKKWKEILEKIVAENIEYKICPIDIKVAGKNKDVWLEQVLIIKKSKT